MINLKTTYLEPTTNFEDNINEFGKIAWKNINIKNGIKYNIPVHIAKLQGSSYNTIVKSSNGTNKQ